MRRSSRLQIFVTTALTLLLVGCGQTAVERASDGGDATAKAKTSQTERQDKTEAVAEGADTTTDEAATGSKAGKNSKAEAKLPPPPKAPEMRPYLEQAVGTVRLPQAAASMVRQAQVDAGDLGVFLPEARWTERAQAVLNLVDDLESEGVRESRLPEELLKSVVELREDLLESPGWTGGPNMDAVRAQRVASGELELAALWVASIRALKHDHSNLAPWSRRDMAQRILNSVLRWHPPEAAVAALRPPTDQYEKLMKSLTVYRKKAEKGFTHLPKTLRRAKPHREHEAIPLLRKRLSEEGAVFTDLSVTKWDQELTDALRAEREFRQLRSFKKWKRNIDRHLITTLNITAAERVAQLELNLERWRKTDYNHFDYKVFVNLPDFHGEVWDGTERLHRFKTVVGKRNVSKGRRINATPVLTARIKRLVYNPTWTVPNRIIHDELLPQAQKKIEKEGLETTPLDYLRSKGYKVWNEDNIRKLKLRRAPGPDNALGKVKFMFDNRYFVFLHDTNAKGKFGHRRRALSHGCMRVHKPLDLAKLLLTRDGTFWKVKKLRVMNHRKETPIYLKTTVPVVIDYITARVDQDGRTRFLWDMYAKDKPRLAMVRRGLKKKARGM